MNLAAAPVTEPIAFAAICICASLAVLFLLAFIGSLAEPDEECDCPRITLKAQMNDGRSVVRIRHKTECPNRGKGESPSTKEVHA